MKLELEYGFNNMPVTKFRKYEIKVINDIKYVVPVIDEITHISHDVIDYSDYQENDEPLIDFINLGKLSLEEKEARLHTLNQIVNRYAREANQKYLYKTVPVLIEGPSEKNNKVMGYTDTMKLVNVEADLSYVGKIVPVLITEVKTWSMEGVIKVD